MAKKRKRTRTRAPKSGTKRPRRDASSSSSSGAKPSTSTGGGVMQNIRSGFQRAAGAGEKEEKPSTLSNVIWTVVLLAAVAFLLYRWYG